MIISLIAAIAGKKRAIGYENKLLYHIPNDLKRFKKLTSGHTIIMGRKTWESLPVKPLPKRRNIIISSSDIHVDGADVFNNIDDALSSCNNNGEVFIIGGASLYSQMIDKADRLYLTEIEDEPESADVFFPEIPESFEVIYVNPVFDVYDDMPLEYDFTIYEKRSDTEE